MKNGPWQMVGLKKYLVLISFGCFVNGIEAQQTFTENLWHDGLIREFIVYVPAIYDDQDPVPLMFNFHGYGGTANGQINATGMKAVADTAGFILVYPQGSLFFGTTHWNVGSWTNGSTADDLGFTEAMIDSLSSRFSIDPNRIYSCGFSNGGYFSFELACQLSHRIAAIGAVGGKMSSETYNSCNPLRPVPVLTIHGTADNIVSYFGSQPVGSKSIAEVNSYWMNVNSTNVSAIIEDIPNTNTVDGSTVEYYSYRNGDRCTSVDHYKVIGGGHDWPGVWGNRDIHASSVIWNFVSQFKLTGQIGCQTISVTGEVPESSKLVFSPNPTADFINIDMSMERDMEYSIYSMTGALVQSDILSANTQKIDVSSLPAGIYFIKMGRFTNRLTKI